MKLRTDSVTVRVPASTSNCGSGFDTLGLALGLYNSVTVTRSTGNVPNPERPSDARAVEMVSEAVPAVGTHLGRPLPLDSTTRSTATCRPRAAWAPASP
jgi:hypothetical protein